MKTPLLFRLLLAGTVVTPIVFGAVTVGNLVNLSARLWVPVGGAPVIAGFVLQGTGPQSVLVRAVGPGLAGFGVAGLLTNPKLTIFNAAGVEVAANDDWEAGGAGAAVRQAATDNGAFALVVGSTDAAVAARLSPGAYTVHAAAVDRAAGVVLVEIYAGSSTTSRLINLSVRAPAGTAGDTLTVGFVVRGGSRTMLLRGVGPALAAFGVTGAIPDPRLTLFNANGGAVNQNDNWNSDRNPSALIDSAVATGAFALGAGSADAAMLVTAQAAAYTAQVVDTGARPGEALVEVYALTGTALLRYQLTEGWSRGLASGRGAVPLTVAPMRPVDVGQFQPNGLVAGAHVTPVDHCYFYPADPGRPRGAYDVFAPAAGRITMIQHRTSLAGSTETQRDYDDYRVIIAHTGTFFSYFDLIDVMDPGIVAQIPGGLVRGGTTLCNVPLTAGQLVGKIGARSLDFGVVDTERPLAGFLNPEHYLLESWKLFTQDPIEAFAEPVRSQIQAKSARTAVPLGGKIDNDVAGRLVGNWFGEGTNGYAGTDDPRGYWLGHLAIFRHFLDPNVVVISLGDYDGLGPRSFAAKGNLPDPAGVARESGPVSYELIDFTKPSSAAPLAGSNGVVVGTVLFEVLDGDRLRVEQFPRRSAAQVSGFTAAAKIYER